MRKCANYDCQNMCDRYFCSDNCYESYWEKRIYDENKTSIESIQQKLLKMAADKARKSNRKTPFIASSIKKASQSLIPNTPYSEEDIKDLFT